MAEKLGPNNESLAKDMEIRGTKITRAFSGSEQEVPMHSCLAESFYSV